MLCLILLCPNATNVLFHFELPNIERVLCAKLLGGWCCWCYSTCSCSVCIVFCMNNLFGEAIWTQHILIVFKGCLLKQSDSKLSQTFMINLNYLIILIWNILNRLKCESLCAIFISVTTYTVWHCFLNVGCKVSETHLLIVYSLLVYNLQFILILL